MRTIASEFARIEDEVLADTDHTDYDADCGIEDPDNHVNITLGLIEDQATGLLTVEGEAFDYTDDEETEYGYITYLD